MREFCEVAKHIVANFSFLFKVGDIETERAPSSQPSFPSGLAASLLCPLAFDCSAFKPPDKVDRVTSTVLTKDHPGQAASPAHGLQDSHCLPASHPVALATCSPQPVSTKGQTPQCRQEIRTRPALPHPPRLQKFEKYSRADRSQQSPTRARSMTNCGGQPPGDEPVLSPECKWQSASEGCRQQSLWHCV